MITWKSTHWLQGERGSIINKPQFWGWWEEILKVIAPKSTEQEIPPCKPCFGVVLQRFWGRWWRGLAHVIGLKSTEQEIPSFKPCFGVVLQRWRGWCHQWRRGLAHVNIELKSTEQEIPSRPVFGSVLQWMRWRIVEQQNWNHCRRDVGDYCRNESDDDDIFKVTVIMKITMMTFQRWQW